MSREWRFGLLGWNISYSLSPKLYQVIADRVGDTCRVDLLDVPADSVADTLEEVRTKGYHGIAVTIPHKEAMLALMDEVDPLARRLWSVNSIAFTGKIKGYNTDYVGFLAPLEEHRSRLADGTALIVGTGAAARTVTCALSREFRITRVVVSGRSEQRVRDFESWCREQLGIRVGIHDRDRAPREQRRFQIAVNCTPVGGWNYPEADPLPRDFSWGEADTYYDLNYNSNNRAIKSARTAGCTAIDGSHMLVAQAIESFRLWTGSTVDSRSIYEEVFTSRE